MFSKTAIALLGSVFTSNAHVLRQPYYDEFGVPTEPSNQASIHLPHFGILDDYDENMNLINLADVSVNDGDGIVSGQYSIARKYMLY